MACPVNTYIAFFYQLNLFLNAVFPLWELFSVLLFYNEPDLFYIILV